MTPEEGKRILEENRERFPMVNRELAAVLGVHYMTVYRHAVRLGIAKQKGWACPYSFEEAGRIWDSIAGPKLRRPRKSMVKIMVELNPQEWENFRKLADAEHLMPHMLAYRLLASYIKQNEKLF